MSTNSVVTSKDGTVTATTSDDGGYASVATPATPPTPATPATPPTPATPATPGSHAADGFTVGIRSEQPFDGASFVVGLLIGVLLVFVINRIRRRIARREARSIDRAAAIGPQPDARDSDGMAAAVAALARRTATLETIVTDPAQRTAREIDALR